MRHADLAEVTPRFKPGDLAYIVGPAGADAEPWGPFGVKKVEDMTGYYGWEPGSQLVHLEGVPVAEGEIDGCAVYLQIWAWPDSHLRHAEDAGSDTEEWPDFLPDEEGGAE